jgi:cellulose 1,4-beta-cellobiosidase
MKAPVYMVWVAAAIMPALAQQHVANPFAGATQYLNPDYTKEVQAVIAQTSDPTLAAQMNTVTTYPTAIWLDRIAAIAGDSANGGRLGLAEHLDRALAQQGATPITVTIVIYDLPGRDCAALASNGELSIAPNPPVQPLDGVTTYARQYIDPIVNILSNPKYANIRIVAIIEPDSLPNLVTNAGGGVATIPACVTAKSTGAYVQGIQYAIGHLHQIPNVYSYLDIGHSGWLGWPNNMSQAIPFFTSTVQNTPAGLNTIDGFVTNTANTLPVKEPFMNASQTFNGTQLISAKFYEFNPFIDEADYAQALYQNFVQAGFPASIGFVIDTSRNGWGGPNRPAGPSPSTDVNTFVNDTKIDRRAHRGLWCNPAGAGLGVPPLANPPGFFPQLQAFVWIKPPGESDGTYLTNLTPHADPNCDPAKSNPLAGNTPTGALPNSPPAGQFFPVQFTQLVQNALPAVPTSTNPDFVITGTGVSVMQANTGASAITVAPVFNFAGDVALSVTGLPAGVTASFAPASIAGSNGTSTLTFAASATATAGPATVTVTGTSGILQHSIPISLNVVGRPEFTISVSPASLTLPPGTNPTATITVTSLFGFTGSVSLSASGLPAGVSANFSPSSVNGSGAIIVNFNAQTSTPAGVTNISINGVSGALAHSAPLVLTIPGASDFSLSAAPTSLTVNRGATASSSITVTPIGGFAGSVTLSGSGLPAGVTATFNPNPATGASSLTFTASATAATGTANVLVTGTSGALSHSTAIALTVAVTAQPDFSLSATNATVTQGGTSNSAVIITPVNGFTGSVTLSVGTLPAGVTATFSPNPATGVSTLTFAASATATTGPAAVTITGVGGALTHSANITLTVNGNQPNFSLSGTNATVAQGATGTSAITVTPLNGFNGSVTLSVGALPAGVTATFNPNPATGASTLTFAASATAATGSAPVTITGVSGTLTHTANITLTVTGGGGNGGVTVTPVINANSPWFDDEGVRLSNPAPITALSITITVQNTGGIRFNGQYNTVGGQITQSHSSTASTIIYQFGLGPGQTLPAGTSFLFDAQMGGTGTAHPSAGDTFVVTYTIGGATFTQSGHF